MEVGYYLDQELGVSFRTVHVSSGPELAEKVRTCRLLSTSILL